ncbi:hypothetical protein ACJRPK_00815 [Aquimarina sp. 2-A2]|uniref:Uncharacterized protein n=1 Tax=Aquimarina intermedia TaxID=350814 RepID=A0A5S5C9P4_9FLAO|nr:hypothetical protein [Aquimarina intermedia]TYP76125.1 hypothetical protein BD809_102340 [Aquimarina intermedia]
MKIFIYILIVLGIALMSYNITLLDTSNIFEGDSKTALIGVIAPACAILLLLILLTSKKINDKRK